MYTAFFVCVHTCVNMLCNMFTHSVQNFDTMCQNFVQHTHHENIFSHMSTHTTTCMTCLHTLCTNIVNMLSWCFVRLLMSRHVVTSNHACDTHMCVHWTHHVMLNALLHHDRVPDARVCESDRLVLQRHRAENFLHTLKKFSALCKNQTLRNDRHNKPRNHDQTVWRHQFDSFKSILVFDVLPPLRSTSFLKQDEANRKLLYVCRTVWLFCTISTLKVVICACTCNAKPPA